MNPRAPSSRAGQAGEASPQDSRVSPAPFHEGTDPAKWGSVEIAAYGRQADDIPSQWAERRAHLLPEIKSQDEIDREGEGLLFWVPLMAGIIGGIVAVVLATAFGLL